MKKILFIGIILALIFFSGCIQQPEQPLNEKPFEPIEPVEPVPDDNTPITPPIEPPIQTEKGYPFDFYAFLEINKTDNFQERIVNQEIKEFEGTKLEIKRMTFYSHTAHNEDWDARMTIIKPENYNGNQAIILDFGNLGRTESEIGYSIASELNLLVILLNPYYGSHHGMNSASDYRDFALKKVSETRDFSWDLKVQYGNTILRAMTLAEKELGVSKFVVGGLSKGGESLFIPAAVDSRIKGVWTSGVYGGKMDWIFEEFGEENGVRVIKDSFPDLTTDFGQEFLQATDAYYFSDLLTIPIKLNNGLQDSVIPYHSIESFYNALTDKSLMYVDSGHTVDSDEYRSSLKAFIQIVFFDRGTPEISLDYSDNENVTAVIDYDLSGVTITDVSLNYFAENKWQSKLMTFNGSSYSTSFPKNFENEFFVTVKDSFNGIDNYSTTLIFEK
ncbi:MAG: PhoPQ-activated protein PqaA family protein [archaeon]